MKRSMTSKHFKRLKNEIMRHDCMLTAEEPPVIGFINSGYCVYFRRFFRNCLLISESNPRSAAVFHSKAAIRRETERHLQYFYNVIHPFSNAMYFWEILLTYMNCLAMFIYPLLSYAYGANLRYLVYVKLSLDIFFFVDILRTFNCGYVNNNTNRVHLFRKEVAIYYLKGWLCMDLICTLNIDLFLLHYKQMRALKYYNFVRILRIICLQKYLTIYRQFYSFSLYKYNFFKIVLLMLILLFWLTSFLYVMNMELGEKWMDSIGHKERIVCCLYRVAYLVFLVGFGEGYSEHNYTLIFEMICWMVGIIMRLFIIAEIVQIVNKYNAASNKYYQRIQRIRDFMRSKGLPSGTCTRILQYFDFRFQKTFYKEDEILSTLSKPLQKEIKYQTCKRLIENVTIFKDLPTAIVMKLVDCLKLVIVLPNDVIVQAGTFGDHMYFIHNGTVAVYTSAGFEVCHLTDGSNFGEVSLVMKQEKRIATVVAVDSSELYILPREAFEKVISPYPDLYNRMCKIANDRFMKTMARDMSLRDLTTS